MKWSLAKVKIPSPFKITAGHISTWATSTSLTKPIERRKKKAIKRKAAAKQEVILCENSLLHCSTTDDDDDVFKCRGVIEAAKEDLRAFYHQNLFERQRRMFQIRTQKAIGKLTADERKYIRGYGIKPESTKMILCIGKSGTGVGSRIGGRERRGGNKLQREHHRRYTCVAMTDEFAASKTCSFCFQRIGNPSPKTRKDDKLITNRGAFSAVICTAPLLLLWLCYPWP